MVDIIPTKDKKTKHRHRQDKFVWVRFLSIRSLLKKHVGDLFYQLWHWSICETLLSSIQCCEKVTKSGWTTCVVKEGSGMTVDVVYGACSLKVSHTLGAKVYCSSCRTVLKSKHTLICILFALYGFRANLLYRKAWILFFPELNLF